MLRVRPPGGAENRLDAGSASGEDPARWRALLFRILFKILSKRPLTVPDGGPIDHCRTRGCLVRQSLAFLVHPTLTTNDMHRICDMVVPLARRAPR